MWQRVCEPSSVPGDGAAASSSIAPAGYGGECEVLNGAGSSSRFPRKSEKQLTLRTPRPMSVHPGAAVPTPSGQLPGQETARGLRAVILLAGRVGRNPLADGVVRSVLDLPVGSERTVLDVWSERFGALVGAFGLPRLEVVVAVDRNGTLPRLPQPGKHAGVDFTIVRDSSEYRGTAGVVKDLTREYDEDARVLVVTGNQILREPLADVFAAFGDAGEGVSVVPHAGSDLAAMFLLRCGRLREVADVGFVDLKEQAIPATRDREALSVARRPADSTLPIRTLREYIGALRAIHAVSDVPGAATATGNPFAESWKPMFSIVEPGAYVSPGAVLQDAVVLSGGFVEEGAAVARSVVCEHGVVPKGRCVVEKIVTSRS